MAVSPACTAYVISPTVEGAGLMEAIHEPTFAQAGLGFRAFPNASSAKAWLLAEFAAPALADEQPLSAQPERTHHRLPDSSHKTRASSV